MRMGYQEKQGRRRSVAAAGKPTSAPRMVIERIYPELDCGRFAIKRVVGDRLEIWADIFRDGHEILGAALLYRPDGETNWASAPMRLNDNDRWTGTAELTKNGRYRYTIEAWTDLFASWRERITRKRAAGQDLASDLPEGRRLGAAASAQAGRDLVPDGAPL